MDEPPFLVRGPLAMATTSLGTLFLHEPTASDLADYALHGRFRPLRQLTDVLLNALKRGLEAAQL